MDTVIEKPSTRKFDVNAVARIEDRSYRIIEKLRSDVFAPGNRKELDVRFTLAQVSEMLNLSAPTIKKYELMEDPIVPELDKQSRRKAYRLEEINEIRKRANILPWRKSDEEVCVLAVQSFKGGVGKSTVTTHLSHDFALKGYRVLVIDVDPQGSSTLCFGINPDLDLDEKDTIYPFLSDRSGADIDFSTLKYAVRKTYWPNIDLIPANLFLYNAEYELAARAAQGDVDYLVKLKEGIETIKADYDIILIDPPPALGMISLSVLNAANALVVPVPPSNVDFSSTAHFFTMLKETMEAMGERGIEIGFNFVKVLISRKDERKSSHQEIAENMRIAYDRDLISTQLKDSAEIENAAQMFMTVLELEKPAASRETYKRALTSVKAVGDEVELEIRKTWPSHHEALVKSGLI
ncbi:MAG: AAA family ATPase [Nitrosopumilus sp.]|nr:AAA family ATPase [Nitrosopumilus sp.]MDH5727364.1 AAA family ATPase [Gammaproteobacteria bacterium]